MEEEICQRCGREVEKYGLFSGGLCLPCYEREYEQMTEEEKRPDFLKSITVR